MTTADETVLSVAATMTTIEARDVMPERTVIADDPATEVPNALVPPRTGADPEAGMETGTLVPGETAPVNQTEVATKELLT